MKKTELMKEFQELEEEKQVHIDGIAWLCTVRTWIVFFAHFVTSHRSWHQ